MRIRKTALLLVLTALTVIFFATPPLPASTADPTLARLSKLNGHAFDVGFMQALVPMDDEAIEMAMTATLYADHSELLRWNQNFTEREKGQVRQMLAWLEEGGSGPTERKVGVATASVKKLRTLRGAALERAYLSLMTSHFDHSVALARLAVQKGNRPALRSFAKQIVSIDSQDSTMLRGWLKKWYKSAAMLPVPSLAP